MKQKIGKRILILADNRTGLITPILDQLEKMGYDVQYIDAQTLDEQKKYPTFFHKLVAKLLNLGIKGKRHWGRENHICKNCNGLYDHIIVLIPAMLNSLIGQYLKGLTDDFICILWDSLEKSPSGDVLLHIANRVFSFDKNDCVGNIRYLPSFHLEGNSNVYQVRYDIFGIFSIDKKEDDRLSRIKSFIHSNPSMTGTIFLVNESFHEYSEKLNNITLCYKNEKIIGDELDKLIGSAKAILDVVDSRQTGLSFRLSDAYKYKKILITDNSEVNNESWFVENSIDISKSNSIQHILNTKKYNDVISPNSLTMWLKKVLDDKL